VDELRRRLQHGLHDPALRAIFDDVVTGARDPYSAAAVMLPMLSLDRA
jgi:hypothetical protein